MKKKLRRNNKGFSLVELIVVVLIMAIIAVALAPQVMKWVGNSRSSSDAQTYDTMVSDVRIAVTKEGVWKKIKDSSSDFKIVMKDSSVVTGTDKTNVPDGFDAAMNEVTGTSNWKTDAFDFNDSTTEFVITIKGGTGAVERTKEPETDKNS